MSDLEAKVKPVAGAMIHDISLPLTIEQQKDIALWAVKTAMVLEGTITYRPHFYNRADCEHLRLKSLIPERTLVWIGRISQSGVFAAGTYIWLNQDLPEANNGYVATFTIGRLAIQTLSVRLSQEHHGKDIRLHCFDGPWDHTLLGICPANGAVVWPPRLSFNTQGPPLFTEFRDRWNTGQRRSPTTQGLPHPGVK